MPEASVINDEMRAAIGVESEPSVYEIEKEAIRRWAEAIDDPNPLYHDTEYAKKLGYRNLVAPPGFLPHYAFPVKRGKPKVRVESPYSRNLNGGGDFEFFKPIQAGDIILMTTNISEIYEREGKFGRMLFIITESIIRNEKGEILSKAHHVGISY